MMSAVEGVVLPYGVPVAAGGTVAPAESTSGRLRKNAGDLTHHTAISTRPRTNEISFALVRAWS